MERIRVKRVLALALCLCMAAALAPGALATDVQYVTANISGKVYESAGSVTIPLWLTKFEDDSNERKLVNIIPDLGKSNSLLDASCSFTEEEAKISESGQLFFVTSKVSTDLRRGKEYDVQLLLYFAGQSEPQKVPFTISVTSDFSPAESPETPEDEPTNPNTTLTSALVLDSTGVDGTPVAAPSGNAGDRVRVRLPILNRNTYSAMISANKLTSITVTPVISASLENFPFVIEEVDYTRSLPDMRGGVKQELVYDFQISEKATSGVKEVKFNAVYFNNAKEAFETATFSVFVNVIKGAAATEDGLTDKDGNLITSTPKLIVESYTVTPMPQEGEAAEGEQSRLFAGDEFELAFTVRNTADDEAVENIQIRLEDAGGAILPAEGGSNSLYIKRIASGGSEEKTIKLQTIPDAEAKSHSLSVAFSYESGKTQKSYEATETLTLPIAQRMRVKMDDPTLYETMVMPGSSVGVYFGLYNMGKSTLYNCMVDVEGEGLRMEESYFGGNISAGGSMRADFSIVAETPGEIKGNILITYEDVYGQQTMVKKPFTLTVMEDSMPDMSMGGEMSPMEEGYYDENGNFIPAGAEGQGGGGLPWWAFVIIGVLVLGAGAVVLVKLRKNRRKKELEDA